MRLAVLLTLWLSATASAQWPLDDLPPERGVRLCVAFEDGTPLNEGLLVAWDDKGRVAKARLDSKTGEGVLPKMTRPCSVAFLGFGAGAWAGRVPAGDAGPLSLLLPSARQRRYRVRVHGERPSRPVGFKIYWSKPDEGLIAKLGLQVRTSGLTGLMYLSRGDLQRALPEKVWRVTQGYQKWRVIERIAQSDAEGFLSFPECRGYGTVDLYCAPGYRAPNVEGIRGVRGLDMIIYGWGWNWVGLEEIGHGEDLHLIRGARVSGRVIDSQNGRPIQGCRVRFVAPFPVEEFIPGSGVRNLRVSSAANFGWPEPMGENAPASLISQSIITDASGRFEFILSDPLIGDPRGFLHLEAGESLRDVIPVSIPGGRDLDLGELELRAPEVIRCFVVDAKGRSLRGVFARMVDDAAAAADSSSFAGGVRLEVPRGLRDRQIRIWRGHSWGWGVTPHNASLPPPGTKTWKIVVPQKRITGWRIRR